MGSPAGSRTLGPESASLTVHTYRQGVASRVGHDLVIEVTRWEGTFATGEDQTAMALQVSADPRSLKVLEGHHGVKALSDGDRAEIEKNIDAKVLRQAPISFRSTHLERSADGRHITVTGDLEMAQRTHPLTFELSVDPAGPIAGRASILQSEWAIKPYSALMGALKVRDAVDVVFATKAPPRQEAAGPPA